MDFKSSSSDQDATTPSSEQPDAPPTGKFSRTLSDAFHFPDTSIVDDMNEQFDEIQKNVSFYIYIIEICKIKYFICDPVSVTENCDLFKQK